MFKLESYITPWLLSYIDQYVKLRREDFQLSLWGGDVVFYNLELRLANIQKLVPTLPIIFQSGIIHELRIHIPWIRINSEPIVVTINQIELVIVLNKERTTSTNDSPLLFQNDINSDHILIQQQQPTTPEQSNYVQSVLARILNNVHIIVNNLIIKFIEENIVISLSSRTAECYAVNQNWLKSFIELTQQDLSLRRLITLPDLTLCLDKRDLNGKVHRYEVPLLSRCSFECRIQMFYSNVYQQLNTKPIQTRLSFNCANIEVSIVDNQLSMIVRLVEIIMLVINQQIHLNENKHKKTLSFDSLPSPPLPPPPPPPLSPVSLPPPLPPIIPSEDTTIASDDSQPGWMSWAWSYVPSVTTLFVEDDMPTDENNSNGIPIEQQQQMNKDLLLEEQNTLTSNNNNNHTPTPLLFAGIDLDRISLQYKVKIFNLKLK
jgi:vacuolar protein sorting-associated protein 13B